MVERKFVNYELVIFSLVIATGGKEQKIVFI